MMKRRRRRDVKILSRVGELCANIITSQRTTAGVVVRTGSGDTVR